MADGTEDQQTVSGFSTLALDDAYRGFLLDRRAKRLTKKSLKYYEYETGRFVRWAENQGAANVCQVVPNTIRGYMEHLALTRNERASFTAYRAVRTFMYWIAEEYEPDAWKNPILKVKITPPREEAKEGIPVAVVLSMVNACYGPNCYRDKAILLTLLDTGMRASELCACSVSDVDMLTGEVRVLNGKGRKKRLVMMGEKTRKAVRRYFKTRGEVRPNMPLFASSKDGTHLDYFGLLSIVRRAATRAHVTPVPGVHDFRRAFAVTMLRNGCDLKRLADLMGHESLKILQLYLKLVDDDLRVAHRVAGPVDNA